MTLAFQEEQFEEFPLALPTIDRVRLVGRMASGERNPNELTNFLFFARHPELPKRPLGPGQEALMAEWRSILRDIVEPMLHAAVRGRVSRSAPAFGAGARILLVGDSHTQGAFGKELERLLKTTGAAVVRTAISGTAVKYWLPRLPTLLKEHTPSIVIVALGANMRDYPNPGATSKQFASTVDLIRKERPGARIVWIGPPRLAKDTDQTLARFNQTLRNGLDTDVRFVDSARHTPKYEGGDGEHYSQRAANQWALGVFSELSAAFQGTPAPPQGTPPKLASPPVVPANAAPARTADVALGTLKHSSRTGKTLSYTFTPEDLEWTARYLSGEAGAEIERKAVLWTLFNRFAFMRRWKTFAQLLRAYSTPLQYPLNSAGAAHRHWKNCPGPRCVYVDLSAEFGFYPPFQGKKIPKGQLRPFIELQRTPWEKLKPSARQLAAAALSGAVPNIVGLATEFDDTATYWSDSDKKGKGGPTRQQWLEFTRNFAKQKNYLWPSDTQPYDQFHHNVLFVESRFREETSPSIEARAPSVQPEVGEWEDGEWEDGEWEDGEWEDFPPTGPCSQQWIAFRNKLPQAARDALEKLDFDGAVAAAIRGRVTSASDLTKMLFYKKYGDTHGYCLIQVGTKIPGGGSTYLKAWEDIKARYVDSALAYMYAPAITLERVKVGSAAPTRPRYKGNAVFEGWYTSRQDARVPPTIGQLRTVEISGRLQIAESGTRRNFDRRLDTQWSLRGAKVSALARTPQSNGPTSSTASVVRAASDGSFRTSTSVAFNGFPHPFKMDVTIELANRTKFYTTLEVAPVEVDLERFLALVSPKEGISSLSRLEFLASVRKIYQGGPKDPLGGLFDIVLSRHTKVPVLFGPDTTESKWLKFNEVLYADGELLDIGHVLTGIEGSPKQRPDKEAGLGYPQRPDLVVTWAGDLGSVFQYHMAEIVAAIAQRKTPDWARFLKRAGRPDLIGDIDGINIGSAYDATDSLAGNLKKYYGSKSQRRFHEFIANSFDDAKKPAFPLVPGSKPPKLDAAARRWVALRIRAYLAPIWAWTDRLYRNVAPANKPIVDRIMDDKGSPEINLVADYFVRFLEEGLANETWRP